MARFLCLLLSEKFPLEVNLETLQLFLVLDFIPDRQEYLTKRLKTCGSTLVAKLLFWDNNFTHFSSKENVFGLQGHYKNWLEPESKQLCISTELLNYIELLNDSLNDGGYLSPLSPGYATNTDTGRRLKIFLMKTKTEKIKSPILRNLYNCWTSPLIFCIQSNLLIVTTCLQRP